LAIDVLENARAHSAKQLSPKHAAGCAYNLGMAYRRAGRPADALRLFTEVVDIYPLSLFARLAEKARNATLEEAGMATFPQKKEHEAR
jgi:tetratricopeptide (TPR) repeat protein